MKETMLRFAGTAALAVAVLAFAWFVGGPGPNGPDAARVAAAGPQAGAPSGSPSILAQAKGH